MDFRVISIGTLAANPLWGERAPVRTGHATTVLVRAADRIIIVDPGLPPAALGARLSERARLDPADVTDVFLTTSGSDTTRGLSLFPRADVWMHADEREHALARLARRLDDADGEEIEDVESPAAALALERAVLDRAESAPDRLTDGVDLFPLPGVTPGCCGLLLAARQTVLICGDAIPTSDHLDAGKVLVGAADLRKAQESFAEAVEIADVLIPGRDNWVINPTRRPF